MRDLLDPAGFWLVRPGIVGLQQGDAPPVAQDDALSVPRTSGPVTVPVLANDIDPEGQPLTLISASAALGTAIANPDNTVTYTPPSGIPPGAVEFDTVVYEIADALDQRDTGQINVTIGGSDLQVTVSPDNTISVIADSLPLEITVTAPAEMAGTYSVDAGDLATGPVNLIAPVVVGTVAVGDILTAQDGLWIHDMTAEPIQRSRIWQRNGADIAGATGQVYTLQAADVGQDIRVFETLSDAHGARSVPSAEIAIGFTPETDPALIGWWDASDTATVSESGGRVSQWDDKAGSAHLVQTSNVWKPAYGSRTQNGRNVVNFDGNTRHLRTPVTLPASGDFAIHMMLSIDSLDSAFAAVLAFEATNDFQIDANNGAQFDGRLNAAGIGTTTNLTGGPFTGTVILSAIFDRSGANEARVFIGDSPRCVMTLTAPVDVNSALHVMTNRSRNASVTGAVGEIALTGDVSNRADYHTYLTARWGIT